MIRDWHEDVILGPALAAGLAVSRKAVGDVAGLEASTQDSLHIYIAS